MTSMFSVSDRFESLNVGPDHIQNIGWTVLAMYIIVHVVMYLFACCRSDILNDRSAEKLCWRYYIMSCKVCTTVACIYVLLASS
jgi:hypothetical protein